MLNLAIPEEVLELILLRVVSVVSLVCAASTCKQWRRIVSDAGFRRRFRSLHGRLTVAGYYYAGAGSRFVPSPSPSIPSPSPSTTIGGRHFSLGFLPGDPRAWELTDSRGSLLLLDRERCERSTRFVDLVICEPVTRRYETLLSSSSCSLSTRAFILDGESAEEGGGVSMSNFRVMCLLFHEDQGRTEASVFTSSGSSWPVASVDNLWTHVIGITTGSIYLYKRGGKLIAVDRNTAEFLPIGVLPDGAAEDRDGRMRSRSVTVTAGRDDGEPRIVVGEAVCNIKVFARLQLEGGGREWALERSIQLGTVMFGHPRLWYFSQPVSIFVYRAGTVLIVSQFMGCIRLDIETAEIELVTNPNEGPAYPCELPWPTFHACR
ncbi:hypothetical protein ACP4OV_023804 [Aristida adscensionis]